MKQIRYTLSIAFLLLIISACSPGKTTEEYIQSGQAFLDKKEWSSAIIEFKNAIKGDKENAEARALLGETYNKIYSVKPAIKELSKAIELGYDKNKILVPLGIAYKSGGESQKILDEIIPQDSQSDSVQATIYALRAVAYLRLGDMEPAKSALDKAKNLDGEATEVRLVWATYEGRNGNREAQIRWLQPLLDREGGVADAWSQMGEVEQRNNNMGEAESAYTSSIELRQVVHFDYVRRALIRISRGDLKGAEADISILTKAGANWPIVAHVEGVIAYQNKEFGEAQSHFIDVLGRAPKYAPSQLMLGLTYYSQKNYQNTANYLEQYLPSNPTDYRANLVYATALLRMGSADKAVDILTKLDENSPDDFRVLSLLSDAYLRQGLQEKSLEALKKAVYVKPDQATTRLQLGAALMREASTVSLGQDELKKALELDPELEKAEIALFMSYLRQKEFADALESAQRIEKGKPEQSMGSNLIALVYLASDEKDKAKSQLENTLVKFPADTLTSHNLARIHLQNNKLPEARALYLAVIEKTPEHLQSLNQLALIASKEGNKSDMMQWLKKAVERNPNLTAPKLMIATQYLRQNEAKQAIQTLNDVDAEGKDQIDYIALMSRAKISVGELAHASRLAKQLVARQPESPVGHFLYAQVYGRQQQPEKMRDSLVKTVALSPNHFVANLILARLDLLEGKQDEFDNRIKIMDDKFPGNKDVVMLKARRDAGEENYDSAIKGLSALMEETPSTEVIVNLANNQWRSGDRQGAISSLELWTQENSSDYRVMLMLANFYLLDNRSDEATSTYQKLEKELPESPAVLNNLAWSMKDTNPKKGLEYAQKANQLDPNSPFIMDTLAMLHLANGDNSKALEISEKAAQEAPNVFDIQINYSQVLTANDNHDEARSNLKKLLKADISIDQKKIVENQLKLLAP